LPIALIDKEKAPIIAGL